LFLNSRSAAFFLCKDSSPTTRSQPPVSPRTEQESDPQDKDNDNDIEIHLSGLSINNSIEAPISISLGSIDNSIANHGLSIPHERQLNSTSADQSTVPMFVPNHNRYLSLMPQFNKQFLSLVFMTPHLIHMVSPGDSKQQFSKPPVHTALLSYPEPALNSTNTSNASTSIEALKMSRRIHKWSAPPLFPG